MNDDKYIKLLYEKAKEALNQKEIPVSALIIDSEGNIISSSRNNRQETNSVVGHAEILAIMNAEKKLLDWRLDGYSMVVSLFPCRMCQEVIRESRLDHVYYILDSPQGECLIPNLEKLNVSADMSQSFSNLLTTFFDNMR